MSLQSVKGLRLEFDAVELQMVDDESAKKVGELIEPESKAVACCVEVHFERLNLTKSNKFEVKCHSLLAFTGQRLVT